MPCRNTQLFDCSQPEVSNIEVFYVPEGSVILVETTNLTDGQEIPILKKEVATGEYVPYEVDGEQVVLTETSSGYLFDEEGFYQLDTSGIECDEDAPVTAEANAVPKEEQVDPMVVALSLCSSPEAMDILRTCLNAEPVPGGGPEIEDLEYNGEEVTGTLVDGDGNPIGGAEIIYEIANQTSGGLLNGMATTEEDGTFSIPLTADENEYRVTIIYDGEVLEVYTVDPVAFPVVPQVLSSEAQTEDGWMLHGSQNRADGFTIVSQDGVELGVSIRYPFPEVNAGNSIPEQNGQYVVNEDFPDWRFAFSVASLEGELSDYAGINLRISTDTENADVSITNFLSWNYNVETNTWESVGEATGDITDSTATDSVVQNIQSYGFDFIREHVTPEVEEAPVTGNFAIRLIVFREDGDPVVLQVPFTVTAEE